MGKSKYSRNRPPKNQAGYIARQRREQYQALKPEPIPSFSIGEDMSRLSERQRVWFVLAVGMCLGATLAEALDESSSVRPVVKEKASQSAATLFVAANTTRPMSCTTPCEQQYHYNNADVHHGVPIHAVEGKLSQCSSKDEGINAGKICHIDNQQHMLKAVSEYQPQSDTSYAKAWYNYQLLKNHIGIRVPEMQFVRDGSVRSVVTSYLGLWQQQRPNELYLASKILTNFTAFADIYFQTREEVLREYDSWSSPHIGQVYYAGEMQKRNSMIIRQRLGHGLDAGESRLHTERQIAKYIVACSFVGDIALNVGNWGLNNNEIAIVDMDKSNFGYLTFSNVHYQIEGVRIDISVNTIILMRDIYRDMLNQSPPAKIADVGLGPEEYNSFIKACIQACRYATKEVYEADNIKNPYEPSDAINRVLANNFYSAIRNAQLNELPYQALRYLNR